MQIQRVVEESRNSAERKNDETMKVVDETSTASTSSPEEKKLSSENSLLSRLQEAVSANRSFLHGQDGGNVVGDARNDGSPSERVVHATLDSLALKRARLPLQLVPIDESAATSERKDKIVGEKRVNSSRRTSPKRPSFKVRPGVPVAGQWKSRPRSTPRPQTVGKFDAVSKDLASRLVIFENIIRSNDSSCSTRLAGSTSKIRASPKVESNLSEHSSASNSTSPRRPSEEKRNPKNSKTLEESSKNCNIESRPAENREKAELWKKTDVKSEIEESTSSRDKKTGESIEVGALEDSSVERNILDSTSTSTSVERNILDSTSTSTSVERNILDSTSTPTSVSLSPKKKRRKPEFAFAKNVLHSLPTSGSSKPSRKPKNSSDPRRPILEATPALKSNLESCKSKSFSREELRSVSISLPTNFVHLASATSSRLLADRETASRSPRIIEHEEKYAELEYLGGRDSRENEIVRSKVTSSRKSVRNSSSFETHGSFNFAGSRVSTGSSTSTSTSSSLSSSSSSLDGSSLDSDERDEFEKRAKVSTLENSQGAPEVVKRSENEGSVDEAEAERRRLEEETSAPVYEAMSEFSMSGSVVGRAPAVDGAARANESFLWGGRASRRLERKSPGDRRGIVVAREESHDFETVDRSNGENHYDAYDDVGLSRKDTEEDHYDDVGLPPGATRSSSTATIFEDIDVDADSELYDDVSPVPVATASASPPGEISNPSDIDPSSTALNSSNSRNEEKSEKFDDTPKGSSSSLGFENVEFTENDENTYLSISNDYSSVEEGLNDFKDGQDDTLYDDVELPSQERVNSLYAGSSSGSQLGSLCNGKESEWEDLEEAAPVLPLPKKNGTVPRNSDAQAAPSKKKTVQRWSRKVRRQKSKASRKNPASRSTSRTATAKGTSTFFDTASDDSNYETLCSFPSDEFSSGSDDDDSSGNPSSINGLTGLQTRIDEISQEAPSRPVPPPPRESSLTETFGKRMKMLRRTWSITKGSLGRMRRRTSATAETETSVDEGVKCPNGDQPSPNNDGRKYFSFKKHFRKSLTGLSTFYLENESHDERLSRNNNRSKEEVYSNGSDNSWYTSTDYWKNGISEQAQRNDVDHYSMLDEEPLYQFYAAAAARVAFESDSEGYEEVEDPMPSPSAADLAKPGHRTLWCQTPQVIHSDLLQRLAPDEKKVQEAKFEIFTSEASYLNSLRVLVDEFLNNHELVYEVLTPSEREKLFGGVPSVLIASERLLAELETVWREDVMLRGLPEVLLNYAQRSSSVYVAYCSNQVSIDTTLKELRSKKGSKFVETVTRIESNPACQSLSLHSFLMLPMQRVTRLPLLADAVLSKLSSDSKEERTSWECVLSQLSQVVMECNEGARAAGRLSEMEALERKLEYSSKVPPIVLRDRYLVRRGPVVQMLARADAEYKLTFGKKYHKASLYLLLLTDYLLIAKPKSNTNEETYTVIDTCKRSLVALEKVSEDSPFAGRHAMILSLLENHSSRHVEYILTCNNATERERWLDAVSPPKPSLVGESLYETWDCPQVMALYPYAAAQPDELTLQPGDVINVLRKMTDGWHLGEKLLGGEQGWFPGNYAKEVASEHVRARNLRQRHRLLALSASVMQQLAKQSRVH